MTRRKKDCSVRIRHYWACRSDLTVVDGIIFKGSKFIIPVSLRKEMLKKYSCRALRGRKVQKDSLGSDVLAQDSSGHFTVYNLM